MGKAFTRADDEEVLHILHLRDNVGLTAAETSKRCGRSRAGVLGLEKRVRDESDPHLCGCFKRENRDGGMPPLWWKK